jgi:hypothetical protein
LAVAPRDLFAAYLKTVLEKLDTIAIGEAATE